MNLIDEQHIVGFQARQQPRQIAGLVEHGTRRCSNGHAHLIGHDVGQGGLSQSWGAVQQHMVQRFPTLLRRQHEHLQIVHGRSLSREVLKPGRSKHSVQIAV